FSLEVFGGEDGLGSPNMGISSIGYGERVRSLSQRLRLDEIIRFHGHTKRETIAERLGGARHVFVSASVQSDEDFGMAAFRYLCGGNQAVLTDWGGHAVLRTNFGAAVESVPVHAAVSGPWVEPNALACGLERAVQAYPDFYPAGVPRCYDASRISTT